MGITLKTGGAVQDWGTAFRYAGFQTVSIASTTGFSIVDYSGWPPMANAMIVALSLMCGCAGSPSGGLKADRILLVGKSVSRQLGRILHPSSVNEVKLGHKTLRDEDVYPHLLYILLYALLLALSILLSSAIGVNPHCSFAASVASLSNVGPAIQELGGFYSFNALPAAAKFLFSMDMFLGRIEIYPVIAVLAMLFDGRRRAAR